MLEALILGMHLGSIHAPTKPGQNASNPGLYVRSEAFEVGGYLNTHRRLSLYGGPRVELPARFSLLLGAATGYKKECRVETTTHTVAQRRPDGATATATYREHKTLCEGFSSHHVTPMASLSYTFPKISGIAPRLTYIPAIRSDASHVLAVSVEF